MKRDKQPGDILVGGALVSDAVKGVIAYSDQIWDEANGNWISELLGQVGVTAGTGIKIDKNTDPETGKITTVVSVDSDTLDFQTKEISDDLADKIGVPYGTTVEEVLYQFNLAIKGMKPTVDTAGNDEIDGILKECSGESHDASAETKLVGLNGLTRFSHEVVGKLGLKQDTYEYNYTIGTGYDDDNHTGLATPDNVKEAIDQLYDKTAIMCDSAKSYYEKSYHKLFKDEYTVSCSVTGGTTINPVNTDSKTVTLTATFTGTAKLTYPTDDGSSTSVNKTLNIESMSAVTDGWTLDTASSSDTKKVYTRTVTFAKDGTGDYDFTNNKSFPCSGTVTYYKWDPTTLSQVTTTGSATKSGSATVSITRNNFWFNSLDTMDADTFNSSYKAADTFTTGANKPFQTVSGKPLIFCSTSGSMKFEQLSTTIIRTTATISTELGTYYVYTSGNGNGTIWNVTVS